MGSCLSSCACRRTSPPLHRSLRLRAQIPTSWVQTTGLPYFKSGRPGPKSGVGRRLIALLILIRCQLSHGVRVPTLSVGVGEGNPQVKTRSDLSPKLNGIQVNYGKQEPTHEWNRYFKRSFKRACQRAIKHGHASYKGRTLTVKDALEQQPSPPLRKSLKPD